ncbi:serine/threonine protein kinase [Microcoleus sp. FACHB-53]|nr:serine/threonine protein kinase [Microcoleus sp. FACHB-53]
MSYCLNPSCSKPQNPNGIQLCRNCGSTLLLQKRYQALKLIGQGGFGRTFLAVDGGKPSKPRCVIKQFFPQQPGTDHAQKAAELFRQEAKRLKELGKHPQIPTLLAYFEQKGQQYLVQECIEGQNLAQELAEEGAFNESQIRELLTSLLPILKFVHEHQVIHRDIKPANIIRRISPTLGTQRGVTLTHRRKSQLVLVDFGAAKFATGTALLKTGTSIGSAEYTAPEQIRGKAVFASDLYSLGVTCIHLLTQIPPFDLFDSSEDTWVWRDFLLSPVSPPLARVLDKLLRSATKRRYQSVAEVVKDLTFVPTPSAKQTFCVPRTHFPSKPQSTPEQAVHASKASPLQTPAWLDADIFEDYCDQTRCVFPFDVASEAPIQPVAHQHDSWVTTTPRNLRQAAALRVGFVTLMIFATSSLVRLAANHWTEATLSPGDSLYTLSGTEPPRSDFLEMAQPIYTISKSGSVLSLAISPDGQTLVSGSDSDWWEVSPSAEPGTSRAVKDHQQSKITVWDLPTGKRRYTLDTQYPVWSVALSPDSQILIASTTNHSTDQSRSSGEQGSIQLWDLGTGKLLRTIPKSAEDGKFVAISPDGQTLASSANESIKLWDLQTGKLIRTLDTQASGVDALVFSQDGQTLASTGFDGSITLWNRRTGDLIRTLEGQIGALDSISISPDGQTVVSGITRGEQGAIATWNVHTGKLIHTFNPPNPVDKVAISPDGKTFASSSWDSKAGTIKIWNLETGKLLRTLQAHLSVVDSLSFSPDGKTLISGSLDQSIKIWQVYP